MEVGFTIKGGSVHKDDHRELVKFLVDTHIMPTKAMADNIVLTVIGGADVNIFGSGIDYVRVSRQKWDYSIISIKTDERLVVSALDSKLEITYHGKIFTLEPTDYIVIKTTEVEMFSEEVSLGIVKILPNIPIVDNDWLLAEGTWNDKSIWIDRQTWNF